MSSTYGKNLKITIFGQSHSAAIGVTAEGLPAGFKVDMAQLNAFLARRAPGNSPLSTPRKEADAPEICCLSSFSWLKTKPARKREKNLRIIS